MSLVGETPVTEDEWLARYLFRKEHVRADGTVKPDPFIPYSHVELSVTRHTGLTDDGIWKAGHKVGSQVGLPLFGRADVQTIVFLKQALRAIPDPLPENPNHANIVDWPADKHAQKAKALEIAREASFRVCTRETGTL